MPGVYWAWGCDCGMTEPIVLWVFGVISASVAAYISGRSRQCRGGGNSRGLQTRRGHRLGYDRIELLVSNAQEDVVVGLMMMGVLARDLASAPTIADVVIMTSKLEPIAVFPAKSRVRVSVVTL